MEKRESVAALLCMGRTLKQISMDLDIGLTLIYKVKKACPEAGQNRPGEVPDASQKTLSEC